MHESTFFLFPKRIRIPFPMETLIYIKKNSPDWQINLIPIMDLLRTPPLPEIGGKIGNLHFPVTSNYFWLILVVCATRPVSVGDSVGSG
jgi:hypothetical protein